MRELFRKGEAELDKVDTLLNWVHIGTKTSEAERLDSLMMQMPLFRRRGLTGTRLAVAALAGFLALYDWRHSWRRAQHYRQRSRSIFEDIESTIHRGNYRRRSTPPKDARQDNPGAEGTSVETLR